MLLPLVQLIPSPHPLLLLLLPFYIQLCMDCKILRSQATKFTLLNSLLSAFCLWLPSYLFQDASCLYTHLLNNLSPKTCSLPKSQDKYSLSLSMSCKSLTTLNFLPLRPSYSLQALEWCCPISLHLCLTLLLHLHGQHLPQLAPKPPATQKLRQPEVRYEQHCRRLPTNSGLYSHLDNDFRLAVWPGHEKPYSNIL